MPKSNNFCQPEFELKNLFALDTDSLEIRTVFALCLCSTKTYAEVRRNTVKHVLYVDNNTFQISINGNFSKNNYQKAHFLDKSPKQTNRGIDVIGRSCLLTLHIHLHAYILLIYIHFHFMAVQ